MKMITISENRINLDEIRLYHAVQDDTGIRTKIFFCGCEDGVVVDVTPTELDDILGKSK